MNKQLYCIFFLFFIVNITFGESDSKLNYNLNDNFHLLKFDINDDSISDAIFDINKIANTKNLDEIVLYIDSNGGSVTAGNALIEYVEALKINNTVTCIAENAYSMAFVIFQHCTNRFILKSSILMQHQIHFQIEGDLKNIENYIEMMKEMSKQLNKYQADRIGISIEKFNELTLNDWWIYGETAIKNRVADKIVTVSCHESIFNEVIKKRVMTLFGISEFYFSKCPFIKMPNHNFLENKSRKPEKKTEKPEKKTEKIEKNEM